MKDKLLVLVLLLFSISAKLVSQNTWFEKDAIWHYDYYSFWEGTGFEKITYSKDTIIQSKVCQKLIREVKYVSNQTLDTISYQLKPKFVYHSNDTIWIYKNNSFLQLYNFNLRLGDTLSFMNFPTIQGNTNVLTEIDTLMFDGTKLRQQKIAIFDNNNLITDMTVVEKLGVTSQPFSFFWDEFSFGLQDASVHKFRCYSDEFTLTINSSNYDCEHLPNIVKTNEEIIGKGVYLYPNPCNEKVFLKDISNTIDEVSFKIYNINGVLMKHGVSKNEIDMSTLQSGMYYITINDKYIRKLLKK